METTSRTVQLISLKDCSDRLTDITVDLPDERAKKLLAIRYPEAYKEWEAFEALMLLRNEKLHLAVLDWNSSFRVPVGVSVNGIRIDSGRDGYLDDEHGVPIAQYTRIIDDSSDDSARQKMLIYWAD